MLSSAQCVVSSAQDRFHPPGELAAREHDAPPAGQATEADVGARAGDFPFVPPARVGLLHAHPVSNVDLK